MEQWLKYLVFRNLNNHFKNVHKIRNIKYNFSCFRASAWCLTPASAATDGPAPTAPSACPTGTASTAAATSPGSATAIKATSGLNVTTPRLSVSFYFILTTSALLVKHWLISQILVVNVNLFCRTVGAA
jgi:hypothetical protein